MDNPDSRPKIGIVCATPREALLAVNPRQLGMTQVEGEPFRMYQGGDLAVVITGMRQSCATAGLKHLLDSSPSIGDVINIGVAGSLSEDFPIGTVVLAESVQVHDHEEEVVIQLASSVEKLRARSGLQVARVLTGHKYISLSSGREKLDQLSSLGDVVEMEAFWIARGCQERGVTPHFIKAISDNTYHPDPVRHLLDFSENANFAARRAKPVLRDVIDILRK